MSDYLTSQLISDKNRPHWGLRSYPMSVVLIFQIATIELWLHTFKIVAVKVRHAEAGWQKILAGFVFPETDLADLASFFRFFKLYSC